MSDAVILESAKLVAGAISSANRDWAIALVVIVVTSVGCLSLCCCFVCYTIIMAMKNVGKVRFEFGKENPAAAGVHTD